MSRPKDKLDYELEEHFRRHHDPKKFIFWKLIKAGEYLGYHDSRAVRIVGAPIAVGIWLFAWGAKRFILK